MLDKTSNKLLTLTFQFFIKEVMKWYNDVDCKRKILTNSELPNNLSSIKLSLMLFFVSAACTSKDRKSNYLLTEVFNNFHAMSYGHIEYDIYHLVFIQKLDLNFFTITTQCVTPKGNLEELDELLSVDIKDNICLGISNLRSIYDNMIRLSAFDLSAISRIWYSWNLGYKSAKSIGKSSFQLDSTTIMEEHKVYSI